MYLCQIKHTLTLNKINALTQKYLYFPLAHCKGLPYFCLHFHTIYWADPELPNDTAQALQGCIPWQFIPSWAPHEPSISSKPQASACYEAQGRYETTIPYSKYFQRAHGDTAAQPEKAWGEEKRKAERRRGSHPLCQQPQYNPPHAVAQALEPRWENIFPQYYWLLKRSYHMAVLSHSVHSVYYKQQQ